MKEIIPLICNTVGKFPVVSLQIRRMLCSTGNQTNKCSEKQYKHEAKMCG